jgi:protein-L-isoaspartate(D-aspartate) O-methyltransferase
MPFWSNAYGDFAGDELPSDAGDDVPAGQPDNERYFPARRRMVEEQLRGRDITDAKVLEAVGRVARHCFVPAEERHQAYKDHPLAIGLDQTISQPYIVALMTQLVRPAPESRALEVGVGSGYQAAILAELCRQVYGVEILEPLAEAARRRLVALGYQNVAIRSGDGYQGWLEYAPFDVIVVSAAPDHVPQPLVEQLAGGGRLVIPVGRYSQELMLIEKRSDGSLLRTSIAPVQFVPMTGEAERPPT